MQQKKSSHQRLRVMFVLTSMPVGGAETLLTNLVRGLNPSQYDPEVVCLKELGPLGEELGKEFPVYSQLIGSKYDVGVLFRLLKLFRSRKADAVVTVGAGDKMFWGRLAAYLGGVPVIVSALHSTGWPDSVGKLNRLLTPVTDGFVGVARAHAEHLVHREGFPAEKVFTIFNGVDTERFCPRDKREIRTEFGIPPSAPVVGILASLRPEKNHDLFLQGAARIAQQYPDAHFVIIGDGPLRAELEQLAKTLDISAVTHFLGSRNDVELVVNCLDLLALTSHNEASPVSILESLSCGVPVVASDVGSVSESVIDGETGRLFPTGDLEAFVTAADNLLASPKLREQYGRTGRELVISRWSLNAMVLGYENLLAKLWEAKQQTSPVRRRAGWQFGGNAQRHTS